ncbi:hypothetical protein ACCP96_22460 (plasmid) [Xanthomonas campestris pv. fici]|uniref:hypothetical protein n=1 Tax=Xanthomonas euvesicatoria TaxID=456327 RepID=UPI00355631F9
MAIACAAGIELASASAVRYPSASPAGDVRGLAKSAPGRHQVGAADGGRRGGSAQRFPARPASSWPAPAR